MAVEPKCIQLKTDLSTLGTNNLKSTYAQCQCGIFGLKNPEIQFLLTHTVRGHTVSLGLGWDLQVTFLINFVYT